jgi:Transposase DDE domain
VSIKHKRKDGYWLYYHLAHTLERDTVIGNIVYLVKENPPLPCSKNVSSSSNRGRKPVHSWEKLVCICILMVIFGLTYRDMQNTVPSLNLPWNNDEPYPDHTWIARTFKKIPLKYLEDILTRSAYMCLKESAGWKKEEGLLLASDSTGIETDRYGYEVRPVKKNKKFELIKVKQYLKWHIIAVLDHLVILSVRTTNKNTHDSPVLRTMLNRLKKYGINLAGSIFNADSGYDGENNYKSIFMMNMFPNIKQRINARNKGKNRKYRKKASEIFNISLYHYRGLIEGIFGAEETAHHHQLYCRFRLKNNQKRFGLIMGIGWNMGVLNRLQCAKRLEIKITQYVISN